MVVLLAAEVNPLLSQLELQNPDNIIGGFGGDRGGRGGGRGTRSLSTAPSHRAAADSIQQVDSATVVAVVAAEVDLAETVVAVAVAEVCAHFQQLHQIKQHLTLYNRRLWRQRRPWRWSRTRRT